MKQDFVLNPPKGWKLLNKKETVSFYQHYFDGKHQEQGIVAIAVSAKHSSDHPAFAILSYNEIGHVDDEDRHLDMSVLQDRVRDDLIIANQEAGLDKDEQIEFLAYVPKPTYDAKKQLLSFGVKLRFGGDVAYNYNLIKLTRMGYIELKIVIENEKEAAIDKWQNAIVVHNSKQNYHSFNPQEDYFSESKLINLIMSSNFI